MKEMSLFEMIFNINEYNIIEGYFRTTILAQEDYEITNVSEHSCYE